MTRYVVQLLIAGLMAIGPLAAHTVAQGPVPEVPAALTVPAGNTLFLAAHAVGTQNYICQLAPGGFAWRFLGPQATLFNTVAGSLQQQLTTHYLSADASAARVARPTWQHSFDSSRVWAKLRAASTDPAYVSPGAIPWLLLETASVASGPTGGDVLAQTTFIQRVATSGGVMPDAGCGNAGDVGTLALVPYETDYFFYRADREQ